MKNKHSCKKMNGHTGNPVIYGWTKEDTEPDGYMKDYVGKWTLDIWSSDNHRVFTEINNCPYCGKKLGHENK